MNNIETNLLAAKIAGYELSHVYPSNSSPAVVVYKPCTHAKNQTYIDAFDIFTSAADREAVVISLGEKHDITIAHFLEGVWGYMEIGSSDVIMSMSKTTHKEALIAAVESLREEYQK